MRVLVSTTGGIGHVLPVVPLARALLEQGHDVLWASGHGGNKLVESAGVEVRAVGIREEELGPQRAELWASVADVPPDLLPRHVFPGPRRTGCPSWCSRPTTARSST
jgi:hypothetical protein